MIASPLARLDWTLCNPLLQCFEFLSLLPPLITLILIRLTAVLESIVRALSSDDDVIVRRAAASALLISLRPYNVDDGKTVAMIAGANLRFVRPPRFTSNYNLSPPLYISLFNCFLSMLSPQDSCCHLTLTSEFARSFARPQRPRPICKSHRGLHVHSAAYVNAGAGSCRSGLGRARTIASLEQGGAWRGRAHSRIAVMQRI